MTAWLSNNWIHLAIPLAVFVGVAVLGLWTRLTFFRIIKRPPKAGWIRNLVVDSLWRPFLQWFLLLGTYAAIEISILSPAMKKLADKGVASLFVVSLMWVSVGLSGRIIKLYLGKIEARQSFESLALTIAKITIALIGVLTIFDIWGAPTEPVIIALIASIFVVGLALRNTIDNLVAGLEIVYGEHVKVGHLIRLGSGQAGYVTHISWTRTTIQSNEGDLVIIPNGELMSNIIVKYRAAGAANNADDAQRGLVSVTPTKPFNTLTVRELEVLKLIGSGATNHEIAQKLIISEHTVKSHLRSILNKLNVRNRQQAAVYAEREGLVDRTDVPVNNY